MIYKGSCHCGRIAFEVEGEFTQVMDCNCSICSRKGSLLWFVPRKQFRLLTPEENLSTYTFNKHTIKHRFCSKCGIHPFGEGVEPSGNQWLPSMFAVWKAWIYHLFPLNTLTVVLSEAS